MTRENYRVRLDAVAKIAKDAQRRAAKVLEDLAWDDVEAADLADLVTNAANHAEAAAAAAEQAVERLEVDPEACPGCGCLPGEGRTEGCSHPDGCGFHIG